MFRALLFDIDKTLTNSHGEVTPRTRAALSLARKKGYAVGVCTGRNWLRVRPLLRELFPNDSLHVCAGGGWIARVSGEVLWSRCLPNAVVREVAAYIETRGSWHFFGTPEALYASKDAIPVMQRWDGWRSVPLFPLPPEGDMATPALITIRTSQELVAALEADSRLSVKVVTQPVDPQLSPHGMYCEVQAAGVNKGVGVEKWCELRGILPSEVIGFGDSENDLAFLAVVGKGIAMGNAAPAVKDVADEIIGTADEDGVAEYIEQCL